MFSFVGMKAKLAAFGAAALAFLSVILRMKMLKHRAEKAEAVAETLKARAHVQKTNQQIKREEEKKLHSHRVELLKEIEKTDEEFEGIDNLRDSNDF